MYLLILWLAKFIQYATRLFGNSGAALPGLVIEKISKNFLGHHLNNLTDGVIVISGTNGKTTTTKLIVDTLSARGKKVFTNRTGSNMTRGLISAIVAETNFWGNLRYDVAVIEVDEAYAPKLSEMIPIRGCVVLNIMRDQLDRFGEIDATAKMLNQLTNTATEFVILNANDPRVVSLDSGRGVGRYYFGLSDSVSDLLPSDDDWHGGKAQNSKIKSAYTLVKSDQHDCSFSIDSRIYDIRTKIIGAQNHLNLLAALACVEQLEKSANTKDLLVVMSEIQPAFGRGEEIDIGNSSVTIYLVKNPASFNQTVRTAALDKYTTSSIVINDAYADSRDVSWLWDVDFSSFSYAKKIYASGSRAYDLAVRLKHEGLKTDYINTDEIKLVDKIIETEGKHVIFCTYTAMLKIRKYLVKKGHVKKII